MEIGIFEFLRLGAAVGLGFLVGLEREIHGKSAGIRTNILVCAGAALFTLCALKLSEQTGDSATRMIAHIVSGIGFLGAGIVIQDRGGVQGLTTAASVWFVAGIGIACGGGFYVLAALAAGSAVFVLWVMHPLDNLIRRFRRPEKQAVEQQRG